MNDGIPNTVVGVLVTITLALLGVVWGMLRSQNREQAVSIAKHDDEIKTLREQCARLTERMIAREEAHLQHRADIGGRLDAIETKLDRLLDKLIPTRSHSPQPASYFPKKEGT